MITLSLYDDHAFVTDAIAQHLSQYENLSVVSKTHTIADTLEKLSSLEPDILISDIFSDENNGTKLFEEAFKMYPHIKIVAFSSITNEFLIDSLLEIGVASIVHKKDGFDKLYQEIINVSLLHSPKKTNIQETPTLTPREKEIVIWIAKGYSSKEIANTLGTSIHTTENQKKALLKKFDCVNSTKLIVKLGKMGLIGII